MDITLIGYAENNVDRDERGTNQGRLACKLTLECLCVPLKCADRGVGHADLPGGLRDGVHRLAKRDAGGSC
jgi:hypothetical protein